MILDLIAEAQADGLSRERACEVLGLSSRTPQRWTVSPALVTSPSGLTTPLLDAPALLRPRPYNALTASEMATVIALIQSPHHADASCRELSLAVLESPKPTYISHVTFWQYQCALGCNGPRGRQVAQGQRRTAPGTEWVSGPNQLWDWDITYLLTFERGLFFYLYSLLDHWSRKNVAWLVGARLASVEVQSLWDQGLINEDLLDQPADTWPKSLSDRGGPMRSQPTSRYFQKLGIEQLFSRPRTPDDNPYIEAHFATIKTHPVYPGYFADQAEAEGYFREFYPWYNEVHPHTRLNMLTPSQFHSGQGSHLLAQRAELKAATLAARRDNTAARVFTVEAIITEPLPDVSDYPCYSWAGPKNAPAK
ncbi:MAG: integrase core domain-containing protein [Anaerolineales bacterium]|nr:integrase core domain-containing protein [Anaerolineales bacterium]